MSTIDPAEARRRRAGQGPGRERLARRASVCHVAGFAGAVVLGLGAALLVDTLRSGVIMPAGSYDELVLWLLPLSLFGGLSGPLLLTYASDLERRSRGRMHASGMAPFLGVGAVTLGVVVAVVALWSRPPAVGHTPDPFTDDAPADWGFGSWLLYTAQWWLPALLVTATVALLLQWRQSERRAATAATTRDRLLATGARTTGVVTDVRVLISTDSEGSRSVSGAIGTVRFRGAGVDRWVERRTRDASTVVVGAPVEVLYDPADAGAEEAIFVAFVRDPAPSEWIPA